MRSMMCTTTMYEEGNDEEIAPSHVVHTPCPDRCKEDTSVEYTGCKTCVHMQQSMCCECTDGTRRTIHL